MWEEGTFIIDGVIFKYEAKVFEESSQFGINDGRVSKLQIVKYTRDNPWTWENTVINYDRGWDIEPRDEVAERALKYVLDLYQ